jgi:TatD family-associated radical SAM protein
MTITYEYEGALYVNLTNKCNCACVFCLRQGRAEGSIYTEDSLWREPTRQEALDSFLSRDVCAYREIVFCGYGEPTYRLDDLLWLVDRLKERFGDRLPPVRINTNGHANLIQGRDVCPELKGRIDTLSISLNAPDVAGYTALCRPVQGEAAYQAMLDFARESAAYVPNVVMTIVDKDKSEEEIAACRKIAEELGVTLRVRSFIDS